MIDFKMDRRVRRIRCGATLLLMLAAAGAQPLQKTCPLDGAASVTAAEVLSVRYPGLGGYRLSDACRGVLQGQIDGWIQEDLSNWEKLSNQACSYKLGWVEHVPGTCTAGGPPPICSANHWYRDPARSQQQWDQEKAAVLGRRSDELNRQACACAAAEVRQEAKAGETPGVPLVSAAVRSSSLSIPCSGSCPLPGYACVEGFCQLATAIARAAAPGSYLTGDDLTRVARRTSAALAALSKPVLPGIAYTSTTVISPWISGYQIKASQLNLRVENLKTSLDRLRSEGERGADTTTLAQSIVIERDGLRDYISYLQQYSAEAKNMVTSPACSEVFLAENAVVAESLTTILGLEVSAAAWPSTRGAKWPLDYGFILADVACGDGPDKRTLRLLTQVFAFCGPEVSPAQIIQDNDLFFNQIVKTSCPAGSRLLSRHVVRENSPAAAEQTRARWAREPGFQKVPWRVSASYMGSACR
jgi:hypothetical protein